MVSVGKAHKSFYSQYLGLKHFSTDDSTVFTVTPPNRLKLVTFNQSQSFCEKLRAEEMMDLLSSEEMCGKHCRLISCKVMEP